MKPADKRYSRVRNDYALHFDTASEVESCGAPNRESDVMALQRAVASTHEFAMQPLPAASFYATLTSC